MQWPKEARRARPTSCSTPCSAIQLPWISGERECLIGWPTTKAFVIAAALEEKAIKPDELFFCENGAWNIGRYTINDTHPYAWLAAKAVGQMRSPKESRPLLKAVLGSTYPGLDDAGWSTLAEAPPGHLPIRLLAQPAKRRRRLHSHTPADPPCTPSHRARR